MPGSAFPATCQVVHNPLFLPSPANLGSCEPGAGCQAPSAGCQVCKCACVEPWPGEGRGEYWESRAVIANTGRGEQRGEERNSSKHAGLEAQGIAHACTQAIRCK